MSNDKKARGMAFRIRGMDCVEEVATLKRELGNLVGGEDYLAFDVVNAKMTVLSNQAGEARIREAVAATGMEATPWSAEAPADLDFWQRHGRALMCGASLALLAGGFITHALYVGGPLAALGGKGGYALPIWTIGCYVGAIVTGGWFVAPKALFAARQLRPDMNLLMTIAVAGAVAIGEWFEAGAVSFLFAVALLLESWSVGRARRAIKALVALSPSSARVRSAGGIIEVAVEDVVIGSTVLVPPGEGVPLDGIVEQGTTSINQAPITGESVPVSKSPGDEVFAGTINGDGAIEFRSTRPASDTQVARIIQMVEEAQSRRAPSEQWVERFALYYTPAMLAIAVLVATVPPLVQGAGWVAWLYQALVILVIACPCALVISTPVSIVAGLATAARNGVLIKGGVHLEAPARLRAIALDKTGTLTFGHPTVQRVIPFNDHSERELLEIAAALEANSTHPLARAIIDKARSLDIARPSATAFQALPGKGAEGVIDGRLFWIGSHRLMEERGTETPQAHEVARTMEDAAHSVVAIGNEHHVCGLVSVADGIRPQSAVAIQALKSLGIEAIVMLTGDNQQTAEAVGKATGVDEIHADLLPEDKVAAVTELMARHDYVAMVGDGVNDAPSLAASSTGIAMGTIGTAAAVETADIALMSDDIGRLPWLVAHSRRTLTVIKQNIVFALGLKLVFIVLALAGVATLWMAIAADMGASLLVIFNGLRLLRPHRARTVKSHQSSAPSLRAPNVR